MSVLGVVRTHDLMVIHTPDKGPSDMRQDARVWKILSLS
jgi:hypothetical protein